MSTVLLLVGIVTPVLAAKRVALIIGNSAYATAPLANPGHDAEDMAAVLSRLGFEVIQEVNADKRTMVQAVDRFYKKLRQADIGFFFYAGHGVQLRGANYLIPIGGQVFSETDVEFEAVNAGRILGKMEAAGNRLNIVALDACRDNPFKRSFRSTAKGLARMDAPEGTFIAYATAPGTTAADGTGRNGIFTKHLLANLVRRDLTVPEVFNEAGLAVMDETNHRQIPWTSTTPVRRYYLADSSSQAEKTTPVENKSVETGQLTVLTDPSDAQVRILNIGPRYSPGMELSAGNYHIEVSSTGYLTEKRWIEMTTGDTLSVSFSLQEIKPEEPKVKVTETPRAGREKQSAFTQYGKIDPVEWDVVSVFSKKLTTFHNDSVRVLDRIKKLSNGKMNLSLFPAGAGQRVPAMETFDTVSRGTVQAGISFPQYWKAKDEAFVFLGAQGMCTAKPLREHYAWITKGPGKTLSDDLFAEYSIVAIPLALYGPEGLWSKIKLIDQEDIKGLKLRSLGHQMEIFFDLGASVNPLSGGKVAGALKSGLIDAAEFSIPSIDQRFGFQVDAGYYYYPAPHHAFAVSYLMINQDVWVSLSSTQQQLISQACHANVMHTLEEESSRVTTALDTFKLVNTKVGPLPQDIEKAYCKSNLKFYEDLAKNHPNFNKFYEVYR